MCWCVCARVLIRDLLLMLLYRCSAFPLYVEDGSRCIFDFFSVALRPLRDYRLLATTVQAVHLLFHTTSSVSLYVHRDRTDYYSGRGAQDVHLDFLTAPELSDLRSNRYANHYPLFAGLPTAEPVTLPSRRSERDGVSAAGPPAAVRVGPPAHTSQRQGLAGLPREGRVRHPHPAGKAMTVLVAV